MSEQNQRSDVGDAATESSRAAAGTPAYFAHRANVHTRVQSRAPRDAACRRGGSWAGPLPARPSAISRGS
eukprot:588871-Prymnesium_polylepis.1